MMAKKKPAVKPVKPEQIVETLCKFCGLPYSGKKGDKVRCVHCNVIIEL